MQPSLLGGTRGFSRANGGGAQAMCLFTKQDAPVSSEHGSLRGSGNPVARREVKLRRITQPRPDITPTYIQPTLNPKP